MSLGGDVLKTPAVASANKFALLFPNPSEPVYPSEIRTSAVTRNSATPSITLEAHFVGKKTGRLIGAAALLDSGAEGIIVNEKFAKKNNFTLRLLPRSIPVRNVDGSTNASGAVQFATVQQVRIHSQDDPTIYHEELAEFFVADIGDHDVILGTDWLREHNPDIDWFKPQVDMT